MGLMQLLNVGRSLSEAREQRHRYKLKNSALPTFGNPTVPAVRNFEVAGDAKPGSEAGPGRAADEPMKIQTVAEQTTQVTPTNPFPRGRWTLKASPFKSVKPASRPVVQGELSLDKVKPLRNDLNDSDLELVPVMKQPESMPNAVKIDSEEEPLAKEQPMLRRVLALFQRRN